jgi:hypothetical protein
MTDTEMMLVFQTGHLVVLRGTRCNITGVKFHGPLSARRMVFVLAPEFHLGRADVEARADECERGPAAA